MSFANFAMGTYKSGFTTLPTMVFAGLTVSCELAKLDRTVNPQIALKPHCSG